MILAIDPGLPNLGWALVSDGGQTCALGVTHGEELKDVAMNVAKPHLTFQVAAALSCVAGEHRCSHAIERGSLCAAADVSADYADRRVTRVIAEEIGLYGQQPAVVANCLPWGALIMLAVLLDAELYKVSPTKWQREIVPLKRGEAPDYNRVRKTVEAHIAATGSLGAREYLASAERKRLGHALDASGIGMYLALGGPVTRIA